MRSPYIYSVKRSRFRASYIRLSFMHEIVHVSCSVWCTELNVAEVFVVFEVKLVQPRRRNLPKCQFSRPNTYFSFYRNNSIQPFEAGQAPERKQSRAHKTEDQLVALQFVSNI